MENDWSPGEGRQKAVVWCMSFIEKQSFMYTLIRWQKTIPFTRSLPPLNRGSNTVIPKTRRLRVGLLRYRPWPGLSNSVRCAHINAPHKLLFVGLSTKNFNRAKINNPKSNLLNPLIYQQQQHFIVAAIFGIGVGGVLPEVFERFIGAALQQLAHQFGVTQAGGTH